MFKPIVFRGNNREVFRIRPGTIGLFVLLVLYTIPVTIGIPGLGSHIVVFLAEFFIIAGWMICYFVNNTSKSSFLIDEKNYRVRNWTFAFIVYIAVSRILLFTTGFDADWFSYPRVSFIFLISFFWITKKGFSDFDKIDAVILFLTYLIALEMLTFLQTGDVRSSKVLLNINIFVCIVIVILPTLVHLTLNPSSLIRKIWYLSVLVLSLGLVLFSGSRAGTSIAFVVVIYLFLRERNINGKVFFLVIAVAASIVVLSNINSLELQNVLYRSISVITGGRHGTDSNAVISDNVRAEIWYLGFQRFLSRPLLGTGILTFDFNMGIYKVHQSAHNFMIELLMSYGVIGTIIYGILFVTILRSSPGDKINKRIMHLTVFGYLAFSFVEPTFVEKIILFIFLLLITSDTGKVIREHNDAILL